ncbi:MAG: hypothetical protein AAF485_13625 [Chloroflexota bacterium]
MTRKKRADHNGPFKAFDFDDWLKDEFEGFGTAFEEGMKGFSTSDFGKHMRNAQREQLMAVRSWLDHVIDALDDEDKDKQA